MMAMRLPSDIVVLAGGIGAARFLKGLVAVAHAAEPKPRITVIGNTGDDIWLFGLKVCPDLDSLMYTLGGGADPDRGWGRADETFQVLEELRAYGATPDWFGLGDRDLATHIVRTQMLNAGYPLSLVTKALCQRWQLPVRLLPMSDDRVETHVVVDDPEGETTTAIHFQEWWVRYRAELPAHRFVFVGSESAQPAPGVAKAIANAELIVLPPSNPVVSIRPILSVAGIEEALSAATAPIVGVSPIIGEAPVRGMADACLRAVAMPVSAAGVAEYYGGRQQGGSLDAWVIDTQDSAQKAEISALGIRCETTDTLMRTDQVAADLAKLVLETGAGLSSLSKSDTGDRTAVARSKG